MKKVVLMLLLIASYVVYADDTDTTGANETSLTSLEEAMQNPENVFTLNLSRQNLTEIPKDVFKLKNLRVLHLNFNHIKEIPSDISKLKYLVEIEINNNRLTSIPDEVFDLVYLTELEVSYNNLEYIPPKIKNLHNLTEFEISDNQISYLPKELFEISRLTQIDLHNNQLTIIPSGIYEMKYLYDLNVSYNNISKIPEGIVEMKSLKELRLNNNDLSELPEDFFYADLDLLTLANNPLFTFSNQDLIEFIHIGDNDVTDFILSLMNFGQFEIIESYYLFSLQHILTHDVKEGIAKYYLLGAELYRSVNQYDKVLDYSERCIEICQMYHNTLQQDRTGHVYKINLLEVQKKAELANEIARNEKANIRARMLMRGFGVLLIFTFILIIVIIRRNHMREKKDNVELVKRNKFIAAQKLEIEEKSKQMEELIATKDKFFSIIGHDLKNPLYSIMGVTEFILNSDKKKLEKNTKLFEELNSTAQQTSALLNNLLKWARSQTGQIKFDPEDFTISDVVATNIKLYQSNLKDKSITVHNEVENKLTIYADKNMIDTIVRNILNNAIKFTPKNGEIFFRTSVKGEYVVLQIKDTGIGMSDSVKNSLFKLSEKHGRRGTEGEEGTGLGLIVSKEFIEKNNGYFDIESELSVGTKFNIYLPLYRK